MYYYSFSEVNEKCGLSPQHSTNTPQKKWEQILILLNLLNRIHQSKASRNVTALRGGSFVILDSGTGPEGRRFAP